MNTMHLQFISVHLLIHKKFWLSSVSALLLPSALAWLFVLILSASMSAQAQTQLVLKADKNNPNIEQIYAQRYEHGKWVEKNISQFKHPHHITTDIGDWLVSDDERYAMFSHYDYPPNKIVVYDLKNNRRVSEFKPAFAGDLRWTGNNLLVLTYGCGTLCGYMRIFNIKGILLNEIELSENSYSPNSKFIAMYPWTMMGGGTHLRIYRFDPIKGIQLIYDKEYFANIPKDAYINDIQWLSDNRLKVIFELNDESGLSDANNPEVVADDTRYEKVIQLSR